MHYYKFNISDWHLATSHLSLEEEAIYFKLINFYYDSEQPLPLETQTVIRRLRLGNYTEIIKTILEEFFIKTDNGWIHERCDKEISKYHLKAEHNKTVGKLGGRPKNNPKETQMVSEKNPEITLTTNHKPLTTNHKPNKNIVAKPEGLSDIIWSDFLTLRNKKKLPFTQTAMKGFEREAKLANLSLNDVLEICCERGWAGFKAEWIKDQPNKKELPLGNEQQIAYAYAHECGGDPTKARFNSYWEMKDFILKFRDKKKNERN